MKRLLLIFLLFCSLGCDIKPQYPVASFVIELDQAQLAAVYACSYYHCIQITKPMPIKEAVDLAAKLNSEIDTVKWEYKK